MGVWLRGTKVLAEEVSPSPGEEVVLGRERAIGHLTRGLKFAVSEGRHSPGTLAINILLLWGRHSPGTLAVFSKRGQALSQALSRHSCRECAASRHGPPKGPV